MHISKSKNVQSDKYSLDNCTSIDLDKKVAMSKALKMTSKTLTHSESNNLKKEIEQSRKDNVEEIIQYDPVLAIENYIGLLNDDSKGVKWNKEAVLIFTTDVYGTYLLKRMLELKTIGEKAFLDKIESRK
jgi:hypothetical protein